MLLLLQVGHTFEEIAREYGDYDLWFRRALDVPEAEFEVRRVFAGDPLPEHHEYAGIVVSGSWSMVTDKEDWSERTASYLAKSVERDVPTLGVCYGHQLLAHALGGEVGDNPQGRNSGSTEVRLNDAARQDALFSGFYPRMLVQVSHYQRVLRLPEGATLLGTCDRDPNHAVRLGERVWGVQFHPEFDARTSRQYIEMRRERIASEGLSPDALIAGVRDSDDGKHLLRRFRDLTR